LDVVEHEHQTTWQPGVQRFAERRRVGLGSALIVSAEATQPGRGDEKISRQVRHPQLQCVDDMTSKGTGRAVGFRDRVPDDVNPLGPRSQQRRLAVSGGGDDERQTMRGSRVKACLEPWPAQDSCGFGHGHRNPIGFPVTA
jgi:hypothetical protein